jgi:hypothetical protein
MIFFVFHLFTTSQRHEVIQKKLYNYNCVNFVKLLFCVKLKTKYTQTLLHLIFVQFVGTVNYERYNYKKYHTFKIVKTGKIDIPKTNTWPLTFLAGYMAFDKNVLELMLYGPKTSPLSDMMRIWKCNGSWIYIKTYLSSYCSFRDASCIALVSNSMISHESVKEDGSETTNQTSDYLWHLQAFL